MTVAQSRPRQTAAVERNLYLQSLGSLSVVLLVTYAKFPASWLPFLFPSTGLLFALGGNLAAALGDRLRTPGAFYRRALRRLLLPLWGFGAVMVPLMLGLRWARDDEAQGVVRFSWSALWLWLFPLSDPHGSAAEHFLVQHLWLVKSCLWLVLLTPGLLWLFRRWPLRVAAVPVGSVALLTSGMLVFEPGPVLDSLEELGAFTCCWLVGFAHHDGRLRQLPRGRTVLVGVALAAAGAWYAVYFQAEANTYDLNDVPLANLLYSLGTVLILLRLHPALSWTRRVRPLGTVIDLVNRRMLTILIWGNFAIAIVPLALHLMPVRRYDHDLRGHLLEYGAAWVLLLVVVPLVGWIEDVGAARPVRSLLWARLEPVRGLLRSRARRAVLTGNCAPAHVPGAAASTAAVAPWRPWRQTSSLAAVHEDAWTRGPVPLSHLFRMLSGRTRLAPVRRSLAIALAVGVMALVATTVAVVATPPSGQPRVISAYLTGYDFADNDPPGSAIIAHPIRHSEAGGTGTYEDPTTLAVFSGRETPGTLMYIPHVRRYFIVEDDCASCVTGNWFDMWIGGLPQVSFATQDACARSLTGVHTVEINPPPGRPVDPGPLLDGGVCYRPH